MKTPTLILGDGQVILYPNHPTGPQVTHFTQIEPLDPIVKHHPQMGLLQALLGLPGQQRVKLHLTSTENENPERALLNAQKLLQEDLQARLKDHPPFQTPYPLGNEVRDALLKHLGYRKIREVLTVGAAYSLEDPDRNRWTEIHSEMLTWEGQPLLVSASDTALTVNVLFLMGRVPTPAIREQGGFETTIQTHPGEHTSFREVKSITVGNLELPFLIHTPNPQCPTLLYSTVPFETLWAEHQRSPFEGPLAFLQGALCDLLIEQGALQPGDYSTDGITHPGLWEHVMSVLSPNKSKEHQQKALLLHLQEQLSITPRFRAENLPEELASQVTSLNASILKLITSIRQELHP